MAKVLRRHAVVAARRERQLAAVAAPRQNWQRTKCEGISKRRKRFRVMSGREYVGTYATLREAMAAFADRGEKCHVDRTRREPLEVYCRKADVYLDWVARYCYMPANYVAAVEFRRSRGELPRAAPGIYRLHLEGKEKPFSQRLAAAYDSLSATEKTTLFLLSSDLKEEYMRGGRAFHIVYSRALEGYGTAAARRERSWWATEVQFNVARR